MHEMCFFVSRNEDDRHAERLTLLLSNVVFYACIHQMSTNHKILYHTGRGMAAFSQGWSLACGSACPACASGSCGIYFLSEVIMKH